MKRILLPVLVIGILLLGACGAQTSVSEPEIPANYTTYTDETGLFSISYPPSWVGESNPIPKSPDSQFYMVFSAIAPTGTSYSPRVLITVFELSESDIQQNITHDQIVDTLVTVHKEVYQNYYEFSRVKTTVGGREATIIDWEGEDPQDLSKLRYLNTFILANHTVWIVQCLTLPEQFSNWEEDFQTIVRSFRILK